MSSQSQWVLVAYRIPREPSTPRIAVWRKLRRLGALQLVDGLVALPRDSRTQEQLEWLAEEIVDAGGEATVWIGEPGSRSQERALAARMAERAAAEYRTVIEAAGEVRTTSATSRRRTLARLRRALRAMRSRDYFPPPEREQAARAVEELASLVEVEA
ncbi:MAG: Chromate resistance protein ChrB [Gaiellaceae bacterium]